MGGPVHDAGCDEVEDGKAGWAVCSDGLDAAVHLHLQLCRSAAPLRPGAHPRVGLGYGAGPPQACVLRVCGQSGACSGMLFTASGLLLLLYYHYHYHYIVQLD